jgi:uncharacterized metal-binding protein YceD (DUF177 family)
MKKQRDMPWSAPVAIHEVPEAGRRFDLSADAKARERIAAAAELRSLPRFEASFDVSRHGREGLRVAGRISATVGQTCSVTLEPIENTVDEQVDVVFAPSAGAAEFEVGLPAGASPEDGPEPLVGSTVDLGALATEFLILGIDLYPRKPGVSFEAPAAAADEGEHPFAALAALKKGQSEP